MRRGGPPADLLMGASGSCRTISASLCPCFHELRATLTPSWKISRPHFPPLITRILGPTTDQPHCPQPGHPEAPDLSHFPEFPEGARPVTHSREGRNNTRLVAPCPAPSDLERHSNTPSSSRRPQTKSGQRNKWCQLIDCPLRMRAGGWCQETSLRPAAQ